MRNKRTAAYVKLRDGMCVACGTIYGLDAHHVETFGAHGEDDATKMVTLCRVHHTMWHDGDREIRRKVNEYLQKLNGPQWQELNRVFENFNFT